MNFRDGLMRLGFRDYAEYLQSPRWSDFKCQYRKSGMPQRCVVCDEKRVEMHHTTYVRLGRERLGDVLPLCGQCHEKVHALLKDGRRPVEASAWAIGKLRVKKPVVVSREVAKTGKNSGKRKNGGKGRAYHPCRGCGIDMLKHEFCRKCRGLSRPPKDELKLPVKRKWVRGKNGRKLHLMPSPHMREIPPKQSIPIDQAALSLRNYQRSLARLPPLKPDGTAPERSIPLKQKKKKH